MYLYVYIYIYIYIYIHIDLHIYVYKYIDLICLCTYMHTLSDADVYSSMVFIESFKTDDNVIIHKGH
jgi:hypothetical protein